MNITPDVIRYFAERIERHSRWCTVSDILIGRSWHIERAQLLAAVPELALWRKREWSRTQRKPSSQVLA